MTSVAGDGCALAASNSFSKSSSATNCPIQHLHDVVIDCPTTPPLKQHPTAFAFPLYIDFVCRLRTPAVTCAGAIAVMDDFTPPAPAQSPQQPSVHSRKISDVPPPLPPPPTDIPADYRASTISQRPSTATDTMTGRRNHSRGPSREENGTTLDPITPEEGTSRQRRGSFGFLSRTKSRSHEVPVVTTSDGHTMLRKQKLRDQEERFRQSREAREARPPPVLPSPSPLPVINTFGGEDSRPDSVAIISNKASNFSRPGPYPANTMSPSTSMPILNKSPMQQQRTSPSMSDLSQDGRAGSYGDPRSRMDSMNGKHYSVASTAATGNYQSPRRMRRRKDPTPFKYRTPTAQMNSSTNFFQHTCDWR